MVHPFRLVLAFGAGCFNSVSHHLAFVVALPHCRNRCSRSFGSGVGGRHASGKVVERAVSDMKSA